MRLFDQKNSRFSKKNNLEIVAIVIFSLGLITSFFEDVSAEEEIFPLWLKDIAVWWGNDQITNEELVSSLQYLVDKKILEIPDRGIGIPDCDPGLILNKTSNDCIINDESESKGIFIDATNEQQKIVVSWIKTTTLWWGQDKIGDQDFMNALQYLVENNVITKEPVIERKAPIQQKPLPGDLIVWPKIDRIQDVKIQGHGNSEVYNLQFKLVDEDRKALAADGTISIVIVDDRNRILYMDASSVKKQMNSIKGKTYGSGNYTAVTKTFDDVFDKTDGCINCGNINDRTQVFSWQIETEDVKRGFTDSGIAKIVFTDRYGNNFESETIPISIPEFN
jgi:hypothetical protein